jgi:glycerol-3-phosphate responsive antiterminator
MKQLTKTIFLLLIVLFISSCDSKKEKRNPDFLKPLKIEIPKELENNEDAIAFIRSSENAINEFSDNIEELALNGKDVLFKDVDEMGTMDKIKLGKMAVQFVSNSTQMAGVLEDAQKYVEKAKANGLDESQIKSLEIIEKTVENRITEINNKYKDYFK